jgi:hypothetical protein
MLLAEGALITSAIEGSSRPTRAAKAAARAVIDHALPSARVPA